MISCTTEYAGEEYFPPSTEAEGEEDTTQALGEEEPIVTTHAEGEEGPPPPVLESDGPFGAF
jgi:hypothetical protein